MDVSSTILAIATPPGTSLRGIIRISGNDTFGLINLISDHEITAKRAIHLYRLRLRDLNLPAIILTFPTPNSYTGENSAEIQIPGNPALLTRVIDELLDKANYNKFDARLAEPGEYTARAFFHEKLSLTQAEGVAAIIAAQSDAQLRAAKMLLSGSLGSLAHELADQLAAALALVEAGLDFTDQEDVIAISADELMQKLAVISQQINTHLSKAVGSEHLQEIPWVVLTGKPNAGKSTLFNALLGRERAVVSITPGTTRDVLTEPLTIQTTKGKAEVMLVDIAGADQDNNALNQQMQAVAETAINRSELILLCVPGNQENCDEPDDKTIIIRTKADLFQITLSPEEINVSAKNNIGLEAVRNVIADRLTDQAISLSSDAIILQPRHEAALRSSRDHLKEASNLIETGLLGEDAGGLSNPELIAASMRLALNDLSQLAGEVSPDDVLGRIFATFCIGK